MEISKPSEIICKFRTDDVGMEKNLLADTIKYLLKTECVVFKQVAEAMRTVADNTGDYENVSPLLDITYPRDEQEEE